MTADLTHEQRRMALILGFDWPGPLESTKLRIVDEMIALEQRAGHEAVMREIQSTHTPPHREPTLRDVMRKLDDLTAMVRALAERWKNT